MVKQATSYHLLTNKHLIKRREFGRNVLLLFVKTQFHKRLLIFNIKRNEIFYCRYWSL